MKPSSISSEDVALARGRVDVDDLLQVREGPDISGVPLDQRLGLVGVDQGPAPELLFQPLVGGRYVARPPEA